MIKYSQTILKAVWITGANERFICNNKNTIIFKTNKLIRIHKT